MSHEVSELPPFPAIWHRRHLLDLESLTAEEINAILDTADAFLAATDGCRRKLPALSGTHGRPTCSSKIRRALARVSRLAARRLGADTVEFSASGSSLSKGESFIDTARNIEAMNVDVVVVRHATPGTPHLLSERLGCSVLNAGDGPHEHPTQGLLDILTIRQHRRELAGLTVAWSAISPTVAPPVPTFGDLRNLGPT